MKTSTSNNIPKVIHYIWIGGNPTPKIFDKCLASWKKFCPDYEIKRWDETNLDIDICKYCKDAYNDKKYAFASDVLRCDILNREGGIYLDIDVELLKPIDDLLSNDVFLGFESDLLVNPGLIMGAKSNTKILNDMMQLYKSKDYLLARANNETVCTLFTSYLLDKGLILSSHEIQMVDNTTIYPIDYFCPMSIITYKITKTKNTYAIHHYCATWYSSKQKFLRRLKKIANTCTFGLAGKVYEKIKRKRNERDLAKNSKI